jgi:hypothetical protein
VPYALEVGITLPEALDDLRGKYREMLAMRLEPEAGESDAVAGARVRARMATLASRFPGALREIDDLELDEIRDRILRLEAALGGSGPVEAWMEATAAFHALARGALWAKRWLAGRKTVDLATEREFEVHAAVQAASKDALHWRRDLGELAAPLGGRITDLVFEKLARTLGLPHEEARFLVFGNRRRATRAVSRVLTTQLEEDGADEDDGVDEGVGVAAGAALVSPLVPAVEPASLLVPPVPSEPVEAEPPYGSAALAGGLDDE